MLVPDYRLKANAYLIFVYISNNIDIIVGSINHLIYILLLKKESTSL